MKNRNIDQLLDAWVEAGPTVAPNRVSEAVRLEVRATRQSAAIRWWPTRRLPEMNHTAKLAMGAAAVVVVTFLGIRFLVPGNSSIGAPDATLAPTPAPVELPDTTGKLRPGTYFIDDPAVTPARLTLEIPPSWETVAGTFIGKISNRAFYVAVSPWVVDQAYTDPCQWVGAELDPPLVSTVDDLVTALANQAGRDATAPTDVMVGGYPGKMIELSVPDDFDVTTCDNGDFRMWRSLGSAGGYSYGPGQRDTVYVVDVGGERLVIHAMYTPMASDADVAELEDVVASIRIDP